VAGWMSKKNSSDIIENRTRDLPVCSAASQPTAPPNTPYFISSTCEIQFRISLTTVTLINKKTRVTSKVGVSIRKKLMMSCIWSVALYGAES